MSTDTLSVRIVPVDVKRVAISPYPDGSGWFAYSPRSGGIGTVYANAATQTEVVAWARRLKLEAHVID